jgi:hypothetical protein
MAAFQKFNAFAENLAEGAHNLQSNTLKVALTNTAPSAADATWNTTAHPAPAAANGYAAGGNTVTVSSSAQTGGAYKLVLADTTFTAAGGNLGPFRYAVLYDSTAGAKPIGFWDYGSPVTLADTEAFTVDFDAALGVLTVQ